MFNWCLIPPFFYKSVNIVYMFEKVKVCKMISISELTGKPYVNEDHVFFRNLQQSCFYVKHHCMPIDLFCDSNDKMVMVFPREKHNQLIKLWMENKTKKIEYMVDSDV